VYKEEVGVGVLDGVVRRGCVAGRIASMTMVVAVVMVVVVMVVVMVVDKRVKLLVGGEGCGFYDARTRQRKKKKNKTCNS
jgi:hypothetical protein